MKADTPVQYRRLPGAGFARKGSSVFTATHRMCRLWLGDDHLLQVESAGGYMESYKRFYFRDIQAIYLHQTNSWFVTNLVLGLLTGLFLLWTVMVGVLVGEIILGIITGLFGVFFILSLVRGPTCICHLKTAVHLEEIPSLRRRRAAEKVLAQIKPLIELAQGSTSPENLAPQYANLLSRTNITPAAAGQFLRVADPTVAPYRSRAHQVLCYALLADMITDVLHIFLPSIAVVLIGMLSGGVLAASVVIALVKQTGTDLSSGLRFLTWFTAVFVGVLYLIGYVMMVTLAPGGQLDGTQWGYIKAIADLQPFEKPWWLGILASSASIAGALGTAGLVLLRRDRRERKRVEQERPA